MTSNANLLDDEIDIRELLRTLFRYKWIILGITLVVMVTVLLLSKFGTPKMYAAQAQVLFTKPRFTSNLDPSIQNTPQTPEASVLKELAMDDDLLRKVYSSPDVSAALGNADKEHPGDLAHPKVSFSQFKASVSAKVTGTSKLYLVALAKDPQTSALIVNNWAEQFITQINTLYSINQKSLDQISIDAQAARTKWDVTETALLQKMPDVDARKIEWMNNQNTLTNYLNRLTQLDLILKDAQGLRSRLEIWPDNSKLGFEYQVPLINIYQLATTGLAGSQIQGVQQLQGVQIQISAPTVDNVRTVAEAKASLDTLIPSLVDQQKQLQAGLDQLRQDITSAAVAYETANYQLTQLTTERDLALEAYKALSAQMEETKDVVAKLVGQAQPTDTPMSNRTLSKTIVAGALAFALSCFGALFINWWKSPALAKSASEREKTRQI